MSAPGQKAVPATVPILFSNLVVHLAAKTELVAGWGRFVRFDARGPDQMVQFFDDNRFTMAVIRLFNGTDGLIQAYETFPNHKNQTNLHSSGRVFATNRR